MDEILMKIAGATSVIAVLVWIVLYFKGEIKEYKAQLVSKDAEIKAVTEAKDKEIKELNLVVREMQKEGIAVAIKITGVVEELTDYIKNKP